MMDGTTLMTILRPIEELLRLILIELQEQRKLMLTPPNPMPQEEIERQAKLSFEAMVEASRQFEALKRMKDEVPKD